MFQSLDHLFYANDIIEFLAINFSSEPKYVYYLKMMLAMCLMPPTTTSLSESSKYMPILTRFYNVMGNLYNI